jgi:hypothetical protein
MGEEGRFKKQSQFRFLGIGGGDISQNQRSEERRDVNQLN